MELQFPNRLFRIYVEIIIFSIPIFPFVLGYYRYIRYSDRFSDSGDFLSFILFGENPETYLILFGVAIAIPYLFVTRYGSELLRLLGIRRVTQDLDPSALASMERSLSSEMETLRKNFVKRISAVEANKSSGATGDVVDIARKAVREKIDEELGDNIIDVIGKKISDKTADFARRNTIKELIVTLFDLSQTRIQAHSATAEVAARNFRFMGYILAVAGISIAGVNLLFVLDESISIHSASAEGGGRPDYWAMWRHVPFTLPVILLTETLALIMFRYQSKSLELMRYFSNEATTLSLRRAGALTVVEFGSQKAIMELASDLLKAERNIILRKDEKTVETAMNGGNESNMKSVLDKLQELKKAFGPAEGKAES